MIRNQGVLLKFMNSLRPDLKLAVRTQIDYDMSFDEIVTKATVMADIYKSGSHTPAPAKDKQWSAGKPIKFEKSNDQMNSAKKANAVKISNKKAGPGGTLGHFLNARKDNMKYTSFGEKEELEAEEKCYICKKSRHMANECPKKKKLSSAFLTINNHIRLRTTPPKIKSAYQFLDGEEINISTMHISGQKQGILKIHNNLGKPNKDKSICMIKCMKP